MAIPPRDPFEFDDSQPLPGEPLPASRPPTRPTAIRPQEMTILDPQSAGQNAPLVPPYVPAGAPPIYPYPTYAVYPPAPVNADDRRYTDAPIHPLAAMITILLDWLWGLGEMGGTASIIGVVAVPVLMFCTGTMSFFATLFIQKFVAHDGWGAAMAKGVVTAIIAGLPFPVAGTAFGAALLAWAGISALGRKG